MSDTAMRAQRVEPALERVLRTYAPSSDPGCGTRAADSAGRPRSLRADSATSRGLSNAAVAAMPRIPLSEHLCYCDSLALPFNHTLGDHKK